MKHDVLSDYYRPLLEQNNFLPVLCPEKFSPTGQCWQIAPAVGGGYYWVYAKQNLFGIKIHDFYFSEDCCLDMEIPECISIQRYDSISGEELNPYRRLSAGDIPTIVGGRQRYRELRAIRTVIEAGHAHGIPVGMCGEFAANAQAQPLLGLGLDEFSMAASSLPETKLALRKLRTEDARMRAEELLQCRSRGEVAQKLEQQTTAI